MPSIVFTPGNHDTWPINQYGRYNSFLNGQWYSVWKVCSSTSTHR